MGWRLLKLLRGIVSPGARRVYREAISDLLILGGAGAAVFGVSQVFVPAAWTLGGICAAGYGWMMGRRA